MPQFVIPILAPIVGGAVAATVIYYVGVTVVTSYAINALTKKAQKKAAIAAAAPATGIAPALP